MYMNGHGVLEKTRELNDALFYKLPLAIIGSWAVFLGPYICWCAFIARLPWEPPPTASDWDYAVAISVVSIIMGCLIFWPWFRAWRAVVRHRKNMERETAARGKGWARS